MNIRVSEGIQFLGVSAFISFPPEAQYVNLLRSQPYRYWHSDIKCWEIPYDSLSSVLDKLGDKKYELNVDTKAKNMLKQLDSAKIPEDYTFKTKPFNHQIEGIQYGLDHKKFLLADEQGLGKALSLTTKVYTPYGYKLMKDICVGDYVFNKYGEPVKVLEVYDNRSVNMFRITFSDNICIDCCEDHLWEIYDQDNRKIVDTKWLFEQEYLDYDTKTYKYYIDRCQPVQFISKNIPINAYILGYLLGTKNVLSDNSVISPTKGANEIYDNVVNDYTYLEELGLVKNQHWIDFIPDVYKYNSIDIRREVLSGILDYGSTIVSEDIFQYVSTSISFAEDIRFLVESMGGLVNYLEKDVDSGCYKLQIICSGLFVSTPKKCLNSSYKKYYTHRYIKNIEKIDVSDARCITVDDPQGLYLIEHFVVTHNTKQIIDLACINKKLYEYKHCLVVACVNGLKYNWQEEIGIHSDESGYILGTRVTKTGKTIIGSNKDRLYDLQNLDKIDSYFIITNIETLRYTDVQKVPCKTKGKGGVTRYKKITKFPIVEELQNLISKGEISMIVADEIHRCISGNTKVLTNCGYIPIKQIVENQNYKVGTYNDDKIDFVTPSKYFTNPIPHKALSLTFTTKQGEKTIICTENHKFLTHNRGYVEAKDLTTEDDIVEA